MKRINIQSVASLLCLAFLTCKPVKNAALLPVQNSDTTKPVTGEKFSEHVRTTEFQTPEEELQSFRLPPGFKISLFASEPDIGKPINMDFDEQGRLWVSQSSEYPFAAVGVGHDKITVLDDTDGDGKADKFLHFADDLDIPIGVLPVKGGAIGFSIPNVYRFFDANGDGKYDSKKKLLGEFGHQDTHGMVSNLIRGYDGWIHACHGFTNTSVIAGSDGDSVTMTSGNTFRFKEDGSRVEQTTYGRVNPFGYTFDEWGYLYSVDCHSKPIYQLISGAEYPHFGKKSPAIGFAPEMMSYELGSTALSGLVYYVGQQFPEAYRNSFYNGDVVTCRINRNTITHDGSSPVAKREEDFLVSSDPWFRPVNIKMGPDGALYIADFYNRIIGHYEVPLNHPGRDHKSGRIWKITYVGTDAAKAPQKDWSKASLAELIQNLNTPQLTTRMMLANQIVDRFGDAAAAPILKAVKKQDSKAFIQSLWVLYRLNALPQPMLEAALGHKDPMVQTHALRVLGEQKTIEDKEHQMARAAMTHPNANVQRMAAEVLAKFPQAGNVPLLLAQYAATPEKDNHLRYTSLVSLRQNLRNAKVMQVVAGAKWTEEQLATLIKVVPDVPLEEAAAFALQYIQSHDLPQAQLLAQLEYIGRYVSSGKLDQAIAIIQKRFPNDENKQFPIYQTIRKGILQRGGEVSKTVQQWSIDLARAFLKSVEGKDGGWWNTNIEKGWVILTPWNRVNRSIVSGKPAANMIWSEYDWDPTGLLKSPLFALPEKLSLDVYDSEVWRREAKSGTSKNVVRIRLQKTDQVVAEYRFNTEKIMTEADLVKPVSFNLSAYKNMPAYIEVMDSTRGGGIGIGNIVPAVVALPEKGPAEIAGPQIKAAEIISDYRVAQLQPQMLQILKNPHAEIDARAAAANALMSISPQQNGAAVAEVFNSIGSSPELRQKLASALGQDQSPAVLAMLRKGFVGVPKSLQLTIAGLLVKSGPGIAHLLDAAKAGDVEAELLDDVTIKERLQANATAAQQKELEKLTLTQNGAEERKKLIADRIKNYDSATVTVAAGKQIFAQNCSMCHQIKGNGGLIGPQLDGIGNWGQKSLTEKILNPNGNISEAFRMYNITLKNGNAVSGLYRREEGQTFIFANPGGEEFAVAKNDIKDRVASKYTLMPDHFRSVLSKSEFDALMKFLLQTK